MDSFDDDGWDLLDYTSFIDGVTSTDICWGNQSASTEVGFSFDEPTPKEEECREKENSGKRARSDSCSRPGTKACRERLRREKLNDRFLQLSCVLEPGRPPKSDKLAILGDAIRVLNQLKAQSQEFKETNEKLLEEIKSLKAEKNELREEKVVLKADKERMEQQLKTTAVPPTGFLPAHPAAYHAPSYGYVPMWQYLPSSAFDKSQDQNLWPPAA